MYKKILLATDLSRNSVETARKAVELAKYYRADISIIHVIEPDIDYEHSYEYIGKSDNYLEATAYRNLRTFCHEFNFVDEQQHICIGFARNKIVELARELAVDLIVVGSKSTKGFTKVFGTTATSVLNNAECDVLTVPV